MLFCFIFASIQLRVQQHNAFFYAKKKKVQFRFFVVKDFFSHSDRLCSHFSCSDYTNMSRFLNRILGIEVELQNRLFAYFTKTLSVVVQQAKRSGRWDEGILGKSVFTEHRWTHSSYILSLYGLFILHKCHKVIVSYILWLGVFFFLLFLFCSVKKITRKSNKYLKHKLKHMLDGIKEKDAKTRRISNS